MNNLEVNTKKLDDLFQEWRGNKSCYDNGRPVFDADELLDFAQFCLKHEANEMMQECNEPEKPTLIDYMRGKADIATGRWL